MSMFRLTLALLLALLLAPRPADAAGSIYFRETGYSIDGRFLEYWRANGGLAQFGFPISPVVNEAGEDGTPRQVQYFERNRFELHSEKARPYDVLLSRLGVRILAARGVDWQTLGKTGGAPGCRHFPESGHTMCEPFASYWNNNGGLAIFGLPITEAFPETSATDGRTYTVQYFERNRFEFHPDNAPAYRIQLGLLGSEILKTRPAPPPVSLDPKLQRVVDLTNEARRNAGLGPLSVSGALAAVAQEYSRVQASRSSISHTGPDGSRPQDRVSRGGYQWSYCSENLAAGFGSQDEVFASWMSNGGHRANILSPQAREIGVGHTWRGDDPAGFGDYWVMVLAAPR